MKTFAQTLQRDHKAADKQVMDLAKKKGFTLSDTVQDAQKQQHKQMEKDRFTMENRLVSRKLAAVAAEGTGTIVTYHHARGTKTPVPEEL